MDQILLSRLRLIHDKIKNDLGKIPDSLSVDTLMLGQMAYGKLEASVKRFNMDLTEYFRLVSNPSPDVISQLSEVQLEAEEALAELNVKINCVLTEVKTKQSTQETNSSSRLPKLELPTFNGDILNWHEFWDQFKSNIDSRSLSDVDKLSYLKASVTGNAKKAIEGLDTTNKNYQIALSVLKERFGKTSYLIDAHYATLYKIKTAKNTAEDCRRIFNEIERNLKILESLGENINHNHLRFMIMEKFPTELIYELKLKTSTDSIQELRNHLERTIAAREDAERISGRKRSSDMETCTVETLHVQAKRAKYANFRNFKRNDDHQSNKKARFQSYMWKVISVLGKMLFLVPKT